MRHYTPKNRPNPTVAGNDAATSTSCAAFCSSWRQHSLGKAPQRGGLRLRHDLLATPAAMAGCRRLGQAPACASFGTQPRQKVQMGLFLYRCRLGALPPGGQETGPNPTVRSKSGTKRHRIVNMDGIPLVCRIGGANRHDSKLFVPTVDALPAIGGAPGRPRKPPRKMHGERATTTLPAGRTAASMALFPASSGGAWNPRNVLVAIVGWWSGCCPS